jgi:predicted alpha-1,6-mannanase (GH76 family)
MTHARPIVMHNRERPTEVWSLFWKAHLISMHCKAALRGTCDYDEIRRGPDEHRRHKIAKNMPS